MSSSSSKNPVAVIGIGCWYPGAKTPLQLWENILARRRQFRRFPDRRLPLEAYYDADPKAPDKTYGRNAAVIDGFEFDWSSKRIPLSTYQATDMAQWLALETAINAVADAGYDKDTLPRERTGVIMGNTLTGEQTRANTLRLRWPFVRRVLLETARRNGLTVFQAQTFLAEMEAIYKSAFPPVDEDTLAGGLSNTIAGRICNYLNLYGGGYNIDGACSSGLLAVATACDRLREGNLDLAIAGGVDISLDPFEMVGFAKTGALTSSEMTVYDRRGSGFIPGEGCGVVVLKRLDAARQAGDHIYGAIHGWGISSDGGGTSITAPSAKGQKRAIIRAYTQNGFSPAALDFIEGHGTGTAVGDRVELTAIAMALKNGSSPQSDAHSVRSCGITSLKSIVGHTKAASGIGGLIKALMAVNRRILPPTAGCRFPHPIFDTEAGILYPILEGKQLPSDRVVHAGVSSMGFGGINCHMAVASEDKPSRRLESKLGEAELMVSHQDTELFILTADTPISLRNRITALLTDVEGISQAEMTDLAAAMGQAADNKARIRAAVVAGTPDALHDRLKILTEMVMDSVVSEDPLPLISEENDTIWLSQPSQPPRIGFLFPGQGSQRLNMGRVLIQRFPWARKLADLADQSTMDNGGSPIREMIYRSLDRASDDKQKEAWLSMLSETENAQPAICLASALWYRFLRRMGIHPIAAGGHSLGELTAFHAAGALGAQDLFRLAAIRGRAMADGGKTQTGAMISLRCSRETAESMLEEISQYLILANINSPAQMVVSGEAEAVRNIMKLAAEQGIVSRPLNVSGAFHSRLAANAAEILSQINDLPASPSRFNCALYSGMDGGEITPGIVLSEYFSRQVLAQVNFVEMIRAMVSHSQCTLFLEMGPGRVLSGLLRDIFPDAGPRCYPLESRPENDEDLNRALAAVFCHGADIHWPSLYEGRLVRPFIPASRRIFIENPCEAALNGERHATAATPALPASGLLERLMSDISGLSPEQISAYLKKRGRFISDVIHSDLKHLPENAATATKSVAPPSTDEPPSTSPSYTVSVSKEMLRDTLYDLIEQMTGFTRESLASSLRLVDDLNLDSIKSGDLLVNFAIQCGFSWPGDPTILANASLERIIEAGDRILGGRPLEPSSKTPIDTCAAPEEKGIEERVYAAIRETTGFPEESLSRELRLIDDLNLDSIKAGDFIARLSMGTDLAGRLDVQQFANARLGTIIDLLSKSGEPETAEKQPAPDRQRILKSLMIQASRITGFPVHSLSHRARPEEDLNMGPEMVKLLITRTGDALGISPQVDLEKMGLKRLEELADILVRIARGSAPATDPLQDIVGDELDLESLHWVRNYAVLSEKTPFAATPGKWGKRAGDRWQTAQVIILRGEGTDEIAETLGAALYRQGARVESIPFEAPSAAPIGNGAGRTDIIGILPMTLTKTSYDEGVALHDMIRRLAAMACPPVDRTSRHRTTISFVQFGGGYFGMQPRYAHLNRCGAVAIGASIHHERSDLRVRVLDFSPVLEPAKIAEAVMKEIQTPAAYAAVGYDLEGNRRTLKPTLIFPTACRPRNITWSAMDVILVTGGARGITADCALAVAKATGCRMALMGSTPDPESRPGHPANSEILSTLDQYENLGLSARYYACDITDRSAISETVARIQVEMGRISGVIHGAGKNIPRLIQNTIEAEALEEIAPKVTGMLNLLAVLKTRPPKLIIGMTSIIGITGMPGNAWYAFSNEALDIILRRFSADHPETRTFCIAYSIWQDQGMGVRLGSVAQLRRQGIASIHPSEGTDRFLHFFFNDPGIHQVVVTARLGGLDTWRIDPPPLPETRRFLEKPVLSTPGIESVFHVHLSLKTDPYLSDHRFQGSYLFPTVFGLEAMAQVAAHACAYNGLHRIRIENIRLERPITVDPETGADIIIHAVVQEPLDTDPGIRVTCGIVKRHTGAKSDFFSATIIFDPDAISETVSIVLPESPLPIDPVTDLYRDTLLFQGPCFQRIQKIHNLKIQDESRGQVLFETRTEAAESCARDGFADPRHTELFLGDPFFRDSLLQSAALLIPQDTSLPVSIDRWEIHMLPTAASGCIVGRIEMRGRSADTIHATVIAADESGKIVEKLEGYSLKVLKHHEEYPTVDDLVNPRQRDQDALEKRMLQILDHMKLSASIPELAYIPGIHDMERPLRHRTEAPLLLSTVRRLLGPGAPEMTETALQWSATGKPEIRDTALEGIHLSLSHDDRLCAVVAGFTPQGCDIAPVTRRERAHWEGLLGHSHIPVLDRLIAEKHSLDQAGTRIWAAAEVMKKVTGRDGVHLRIDRAEANAVLFSSEERSDGPCVLTFPILLTWGPERIIAVTAEKSTVNEIKTAPHFTVDMGFETLFNPPTYEFASGGPQGRKRFILRRPVTFKPSANLSRTIYFSNYIHWMGECREASAWPVLQKMSRQFATGKWGGVTNYGHLKILGEGTTSDCIEIRMWTSDNSGPENSTMTLTYDFRKIRNGRGAERLAWCTLQTTWVEILGSGKVRVAPYPDYYADFIESMLIPSENRETSHGITEPLLGLRASDEAPLIYESPKGPVVRPLLREQIFDTTLVHANLVGNIYYANYYDWQGQIRDRYFYDIIPDYFQGIGDKGELICLESRVDHLREAMPFDRIVLCLSLKRLSRTHVVMHFDYYRLLPDDQREKIAFGEQTAVWAVRNHAGKPSAAPFPRRVRDAFERTIEYDANHL